MLFRSVQSERRIVQDQQLGFWRQCQSQAEARPLAPRKVLPPRRGLEVEMPDDAAEDFFIPTRIKLRLKSAAFLDSHPVVKLVFLGQVADARPGFRRQGADVMTQDAALAAGRQIGRASCKGRG